MRKDVMRTMSPRRSRGFAFIELLFVLLILLILVGGYSYFGGFGEGVDQGTAEMAMDRASMTACRASRAGVMANIEMWEAAHPGQPVTNQALHDAHINMRCPVSKTGGTFVLVDGQLYCTDHEPPPAASPGAPAPAASSNPQSAVGNLLQQLPQTP
jgi:prepilin-type N-terminal cleavage/methylation domain-containing protein